MGSTWAVRWPRSTAAHAICRCRLHVWPVLSLLLLLLLLLLLRPVACEIALLFGPTLGMGWLEVRAIVAVGPEVSSTALGSAPRGGNRRRAGGSCLPRGACGIRLEGVGGEGRPCRGLQGF